jgi:hypothetical protein
VFRNDEVGGFRNGTHLGADWFPAASGFAAYKDGLLSGFLRVIPDGKMLATA